MNKGIDLEREKAELKGDEWVFGAVSPPCIFSVPAAARETYLPIGELQFGADDFMDCATRGPLNLLETKFTFAYRHGLLLPVNKLFLEKHGYVAWIGGLPYVQFSDRFIAMLSGTTRQGNSLKGPVDTIRKKGLIPKAMLPRERWMTFDQYHDKTTITKEMYDLGEEFASRFSISYEQVQNDSFPTFDKDILDTAVYAWPPPTNGVYQRTLASFNHVVMVFRPQYKAFDNYEESAGDFIKDLAPDYNFYDYGYRIYIASQQDYEKIISVYQQLLATLKMWLALKLQSLGRAFGFKV